MAFYVLLIKVREDDAQAIYRFGPNEQIQGTLRLDKATGDVEQMEPVPHDVPEAYFMRAAVKIRQHWQQQSMPERTSWAS